MARRTGDREEEEEEEEEAERAEVAEVSSVDRRFCQLRPWLVACLVWNSPGPSRDAAARD